MSDADTEVLDYAPNLQQRPPEWLQRLVIWLKGFAVIAVCGVISYYLQTPTYTAIGYIFVSPPPSNSNTNVINKTTKKMVAFLQQTDTQQAALKRSSRLTKFDVDTFRRNIRIKPIDDSKLFQISFTDAQIPVALDAVDVMIGEGLLLSPSNWSIAAKPTITPNSPTREFVYAVPGFFVGWLIVIAYMLRWVWKNRAHAQKKPSP
jgi:hypothetical protein